MDVQVAADLTHEVPENTEAEMRLPCLLPDDEARAVVADAKGRSAVTTLNFHVDPFGACVLDLSLIHI